MVAKNMEEDRNAKKKTLRAAARRRKGHDYERKIARWLRDCIGLPARRTWQFRSGEEAPDVTAGPFAVETKHQKSPNVRAALEQACASANPGQWPLAVVKWNGMADKDAIVAMRAEDFEDLVVEWRERGESK